MKILKIISLILLVIFILAVFLLFYLGAFTSLAVQEKTIGPYTFVYEKITGDYSKSGKVMQDLYYRLKGEEGIETFKGIGIYYDDPRFVAKDKLRSVAGCVLEKNDYHKILNLRLKGYKIMNHPQRMSLVVEFPYKNMASIYVGMARAYPLLNKYIKENNYKLGQATEIYDLEAKKIIYAIPLKKQ